ncbi:MAG: hypothetical protein L0Y71_08920 [Gemmataceae bacterium]|nr:hypothetical protein [Gemmataceae bacterium]
MSEVLQPGQLQRLRQIELQLQGPRAFHDSHGADALKLTADQKRQIRDIREEMIATQPPGPPGKGGGGFGKTFELYEKRMKLEVERILAVLTADQRAAWQELVGAPFEGRVRPGFGMIGSRPPFGGGGPGNLPGNPKGEPRSKPRKLPD